MNVRGIVVLDPKWLCTSFSAIFEGRHRWAQDTNYDELGGIFFCRLIYFLNALFFNSLFFVTIP
jgi:hypothetical protein